MARINLQKERRVHEILRSADTACYKTVLYDATTFYGVAQVLPFESIDTNETIDLPICSRKFKSLSEAEECFDEWTSVY